MSTLYDHGIEVHPLCRGWTLHSGADSENGPTFRGFFIHRSDAEQAATQRDPEDPESPLYFDHDISPAVLTEHGVVTSNDCDLDTPEKLVEHIRGIDLSEFT